jgi:nucleoside-diphosphate-sugar epimerase
MRVLVTGGTGFVGAALLTRLSREPGVQPVALVRSPAALPPGVEVLPPTDLTAVADWTAVLRGVTVVVHAAARVHLLHDRAADPLAEYRRVNVDATTALARAAVANGVRRFVFLSTAKVHGEHSAPGRPFRVSDAPVPRDPYAISKLEAEEALRAIASDSGLEVVVVRPPLVYGPGVKANFAAMVRSVQRGWPLPLGSIRNTRSLCGVDNLVDLLRVCLDHPAAAQRTFLVSDGEDVSTPELLRRVARALGVRSWLLPVPSGWIRVMAGCTGQRAAVERLLGSLQLDIAPTCSTLSWHPPVSLDEGLLRTVRRHTQ